MKEKKQKSAHFRHGGMAILMTAVMLAILILINVAAVMLVDKYPLVVDMTSKRENSLSAENAEMIKGFQKPVTITVLGSEDEFLSTDSLADQSIIDTSGGNYGLQAVTLLQNYEKLNQNITLKFLDTQSPAFGTFKSNHPDLDLSVNSIVVETENRTRVLTLRDIMQFGTEGYYYTTAASTLESALTSAIMQGELGDADPVTLIGGHGGSSIGYLSEVLANNNYDVQTLESLTLSDIPSDSVMAIICAPTVDYTADEIEKLEAYLDNGGKSGRHIFYIASEQQPSSLPNLDAFLAKYGMRVTPGCLIAETDANRSGSQSPLITYFDYADTSTFSRLNKNQLYCYTTYHRPIEILDVDDSNITVTPLLTVPESAYLYPMDEEEAANLSNDTATFGPFNGFVKSEIRGSGEAVSTISVCGSTYFLSEEVLSSSIYGNADFLMIHLNSVLGRDNPSIFFNAKTIGDTSFQVNAFVSSLIGFGIFILLIPIATLAIGLGIWIWRNKR